MKSENAHCGTFTTQHPGNLIDERESSTYFTTTLRKQCENLPRHKKRCSLRITYMVRRMQALFKLLIFLYKEIKQFNSQCL